MCVCVFETLRERERERERERLFSAYLFEGREGEEKGASCSLEYSIVCLKDKWVQFVLVYRRA